MVAQGCGHRTQGRKHEVLQIAKRDVQSTRAIRPTPRVSRGSLHAPEQTHPGAREPAPTVQRESRSLVPDDNR